MGLVDNSLSDDLQSVYESVCESLPSHQTVILQNTQRLNGSDSLFYTPVVVNGCVTVTAMLDTGSMACSVSEAVEMRLIAAGNLNSDVQQDLDIVLIGCGGKRVYPKRVCDLQLEVYGCTVTVPTLVVPGQVDEFIIGTNVIKYLTHKFKESDAYWKMISETTGPDVGGRDDFLAMLAGVHRWKGEDVPDMVGTVKLTQAVTLLPGHEHLVWGRLPEKSRGTPGCTVVVEPTKSRSIPRHILVGRVVTPLWGDGWVPMKVINPTDKPIMIKRNAKLADVFPCLAVEEIQPAESSCFKSNSQHVAAEQTPDLSDMTEALRQHGLSDLDLGSCEVSDRCKTEMCKCRGLEN